MKDFDDLLNVFLNVHRVPAQGPARQQASATTDSDAQDLQHAHPESPASNYNTTNFNLNQRAHHRGKLPIIEITSPGSGGGKSQLVYYLIAISILPSVFNGVKLGGRDAAVVLLDTDGRFDITRVYEIANGLIRHSLRAHTSTSPAAAAAATTSASDTGDIAISTSQISILIRDSLQHIHIFRPQTSSSLLSTLKSLDDYLLNNIPHQQHRSSTRPLSAVFLDSASAFYWTDRLRDEVARTQEISRDPKAIQQDRETRKTFYINILYQDIATELRRIQAIFECAVVYTTWGISPTRSSSTDGSSSNLNNINNNNRSYAHLWSGPPSFKPHLPPPWNTLPDLRLVVQRDPVRGFPATATLTELERDAPIRQGVVKRGKFSAWVDTWGSEFWPPTIFSALRSMPDNGGFPFWVREDGVFMDDLMGDTV